MNLLPLLLLIAAPAQTADAELAKCAAVMRAYQASQPEGVWNDESAHSLAAASYFIGKLEQSVSKVHPDGFMARTATRNLVSAAAAKVTQADLPAVQKCSEEYLRATDF